MSKAELQSERKFLKFAWLMRKCKPKKNEGVIWFVKSIAMSRFSCWVRDKMNEVQPLSC